MHALLHCTCIFTQGANYQITSGVTTGGVVLKKKWGRLKQDSKILKQFRPTDTYSYTSEKLPQRTFGLVLPYSYSCLSVYSRSMSPSKSVGRRPHAPLQPWPQPMTRHNSIAFQNRISDCRAHETASFSHHHHHHHHLFAQNRSWTTRPNIRHLQLPTI